MFGKVVLKKEPFMRIRTISILSLLFCSSLSSFASAAGTEDLANSIAEESYSLPEVSNSGLFRGGYIDSGLVLGRIGHFESRGYIFKGWEFIFNFGDLGDGVISRDEITAGNIGVATKRNAYFGIPFLYSTLNSDVFRKPWIVARMKL